MIRLVILGGPGAGKSTQSRKLCEALHLQQVAVGDILRRSIAMGSALGTKAESYMNQGKLVPDELMIQFMRDRLMQADMRSGWIFEGYPRTAFQAEELDFLLDALKQNLDWAIYLKVADDIHIERSLARGLADDKPEIIQKRLNAFHQSTMPILDYYSKRDKLLTVDAEKSVEEVTKILVESLTKS